MRSLMTSFLGGWPPGTLTLGFGRGFAVAGAAACVVVWSLDAEASDDEVLSSLDPQPAAARARAAESIRARGRRDMARHASRSRPAAVPSRGSTACSPPPAPACGTWQRPGAGGDRKARVHAAFNPRAPHEVARRSVKWRGQD